MTPIQSDPNHSVNTLVDSTLEQALSNSEFAAQQRLLSMNMALKTGYLQVFNDWAINVMAGRVPNTNPPAPPAGYVIGHFTDATNDKAIWPYVTKGADPVCAMPPIPGVVKHQLGYGLIGVALPGVNGWFQSLTGDTAPDNTVVPGTSQDGVTGLFRKVSSPFGSDASTGTIGGWWVKVG